MSSKDYKYFSVGDYLISEERTMEDFPAHEVIFKDGTIKRICGIELFEILKNENLSHPIIDEYEMKTNFIISGGCMESYPCRHHIRFKDGTETRMNGVEIYEMLVEKGLEIPTHFQEYKDFKLRKFPTLLPP